MLTLTAPFSVAARHASLIRELAKREVLGRYRGASFGLLWALISPFLMLGVYTLAFGSILGSHWPAMPGQHHSFALILFIGLIIHAFFSECVNQAPRLVSGNPSYVKKVVFPLEILPLPMTLSAIFHLLMNFAAYIVLALALGENPGWTMILFPIAVLPLVFLSLGVSWMLAALGVYFRDINQITGVATTTLLFTSTAIIPITAIPEDLRWLFKLNPLSFIIDQARNVAIWGTQPDWLGLGLYGVGALVVYVVGYNIFGLTRRGFADVL
ncbi:ABC transporter permease [Xanthomonas hortorum]|uniref:ABC transporter permease n=1 Tax=Xanthomonas hortorum TaxID=56454 RepID=UPI0029355FEF|nr:ABC transporter permease [Xanthomonas hortorum]MDV2449665.1 ABC transporter permease [Xanthomonas hortorum NBC5720]